ncbi:MAG: hypothetical protein H0W94_06285 [Actinobacteria bacterium]|nr:hypothetical protein [Actinomycetota bacterium]
MEPFLDQTVGAVAVPRGDSLTYADSPVMVAQATTCVLPDEGGRASC